MSAVRDPVAWLEHEIERLREVPRDMAALATRIELVDERISRLCSSVDDLSTAITQLDTVIRGDGRAQGVIGRVRRLESQSHLAVAQATGESRVSAARVAAIASVVVAIAAAVGALVGALV